MADALLAALRQKAERHLVYPLNRDECLALIEIAEGAVTRESALALIEDAKRWQRAYDEARNEIAALVEATP